ncbi:MAG TPA: protein kinase [Gemmataceae bacterium]|nr:protein kinase [Gemmataceae bacterium]
MTATCPDPAVLRGLLDSSLPEPVQAEVVAHLDSCAHCQERLQDLAADGSGLLDTAKGAKSEVKPEETSAFWPALRRVEREIRSPAAAFSVTRTDTAVVAPPTRETDFSFLDPPEDPEHLGQIDRFKIVELVGRGGMGMVFRAFDACLQRTVALKTLEPQYARNELARSRFIREARAAAAVTHENVVTIHHVACVEEKDLSYLVMQFVRGRSLQDRLDEGGALPVREAVRIAAATASGLAAAHATNLIHRDIKPGNILIEQSSGRVLLTDFGLARLTEDVRLTQSGFVAGTPLYMSPEQARGEEVDHRSDLFSLGSVLYTMLTGEPPFQGSSPFTVLKQVTDSRPKAVQSLNPAVPNSLADVLDKLMEKVPKNRFADAAEAACALQAELAKLPLEQPPVDPAPCPSRSVPRYVRSWWRRHGSKVVAGAAAVFGLFFLAEATKLTRFTVLGQRGQPLVERMAESGLLPGPVEEPETPPRYTLPAGDGAVWSVAFDPTGELIATATEGGTVKFWDARDGHVRGMLNNQRYKSPVWALAFNRDGDRLLTASDDGYVRVWDVKTRLQTDVDFQHPFPVRSLALSPDGKTLASGMRNGGVIIWNVETGKKIHTTVGHDGGIVTSIAFSPDGKLVASGSSDRSVMLWEVADGSQRATLGGHTGPVYAVAFEPKSQFVASGGWDRTIRIWDANTSQQVKMLDVYKDDIYSLAYSPSGRYLIAGGQDRTAKWIDVESGAVKKVYRGHTGPIHTVAVSQDGALIAAGGRDGTVRVWESEP